MDEQTDQYIKLLTNFPLLIYPRILNQLNYHINLVELSDNYISYTTSNQEGRERPLDCKLWKNLGTLIEY